ncbi:flagellar hook assembly protein FlgD [Methylobacterium hispanicum]|uniref:flagellar hook assembly protein FlgD n=1 Tax=Methylobacterium hispanicum TaxID=270350 RepID=UPI002F32F65B
MASGITGAASAAATTSKTGSGTSAQEIAGNFTQFLTLLTTQLKNQNPLDPMDTNQFTQQLVQFAGVEQQLKANDRLDSILASSKAASTASATSYIGQTIESTGTTADLKDGAATWTLNAARAAPRAKVTILDAKGNTVGQQDLSLNAGSQAFTWNGKNAAGISQPAGTYTIKIGATDATGTTVKVETGVSGKVDEVDLSGSEPVLVVGNNRVPLSSVTSVGLSTTSG